MADSPMNSSVSRVALTIMVDGSEVKEEFLVQQLFIEKEIGRINEARVVFMDGDPAKATFPVSESTSMEPGKTLKIKLGYGTEEEVAFDGVITAQAIKVRNYEHRRVSQLVLTAKDKAYTMDVAPKTVQFDEKKDSEAISTVLGDHSVAGTVKATTFKHKSLVQFQMTDWEFVLERARANGLIVLCDDGKVNVEEPKLKGTAELTLDYGSSVFDFQAEMKSESQVKSATYKAWTDADQKVAEGKGTEPAAGDFGNIGAAKLFKANKDPELEFSSPVPEDTSVLKNFADSDMMYSRLSRIRGSVSFVGSSKVSIGKWIELKGFGERFNGIAYVRRVCHEVENGFWKTEVGFGLDYDPRRMSLLQNPGLTQGRLSEMQGLHLGKVKQIDTDPDGAFRVLVDIPSIKKDGTGIWARLSSNLASNEFGFYFYPEVEDEVVLGFFGGDPRFPVILGSVYSKKNKTPYTPDKENAIKGIVTKKEMKVTFDEKEMVMVLETKEGQKITLNDKEKSVLLEDGNKNKVELSKDGIVIDSAKDLTIKAKGSVSITGQQDVSLESKGGDVSFKGLNIASKASVAFKAEGSASAELKASGNVVVKGAMVNIN